MSRAQTLNQNGPPKDQDVPVRSVENSLPSRETIRRRQFNIYDAVAGLITSNTTTTASGIRSDSKAAAPNRATILSPGDALLRALNAPEQFEEYDIYDAASRLLPDGGDQTLPSGELLEGLHEYASHFYEAMARTDRGKEGIIGGHLIDERSFDETALIALGILVEEASREVLGKRGDLVFTEGREVIDTHKSRKKRTKTSETHYASGKVEGQSQAEATKSSVERGRQPHSEKIVGALAENPWVSDRVRKDYNKPPKRQRLD